MHVTFEPVNDKHVGFQESSVQLDFANQKYCYIGNGREGGNADVVANHGIISRKHCHLSVNQRFQLGVTDTSTNGTWLNNERLPKGQTRPVNDGDILHFAEVTECDTKVIKLQDWILQNQHELHKLNGWRIECAVTTTYM